MGWIRTSEGVLVNTNCLEAITISQSWMHDEQKYVEAIVTPNRSWRVTPDLEPEEALRVLQQISAWLELGGKGVCYICRDRARANEVIPSEKSADG